MPDDINKVVFPSLSEDGWVYSSKRQADLVMANFLASDRSQSYIHSSDISSFGWLIATYSGDPETLIIEMKSALEKLFNRYFDNVVVQCWDSTDPKSPSKFILSIFVEFQLADGKTSNISELLSINGSKFERIRALVTDNNS